MTKPTSHLVRLIALSLVLAGIMTSPSTATVIGTFSAARSGVHSAFNLFNGNLMDSARADLATDGHSLVNLDAGISAASLTGIDKVYLPLSVIGSPPALILSAAEVTALSNFVAADGDLIVQGDTANFGPAYNNVAGAFGVQYDPDLSISGLGFTTFGVVNLTASFPGLTDGPFGTASSLATASSGKILPGASAGISLLDTPNGGSFLYVMGPETGFTGGGHVIFLSDVNSFDDPENTDGYGQGDGAVFWRNMLALGESQAVPEPAMLSVFGLGLAGLGLARRRRPVA